jgi:hypothetical protein
MKRATSLINPLVLIPIEVKVTQQIENLENRFMIDEE